VIKPKEIESVWMSAQEGEQGVQGEEVQIEQVVIGSTSLPLGSLESAKVHL
jgi:hypothetical protein